MPLSHAVSLLLFTPMGTKPSPQLGRAPCCTRWHHQLPRSFHRRRRTGGGRKRGHSMFVSSAAGAGACGFAVISCVARGPRLGGWTPPSSPPPASSCALVAQGAVSPVGPGNGSSAWGRACTCARLVLLHHWPRRMRETAKACHPPGAPRAGSALPLCTSNEGTRTRGSSPGCPDTAPCREGLAASILYLPSMTIKQRGALTSPPSHDPPWCLTGFLKGQIFPLRSHSLGLCSSRPSPVSQLAFPQRSIISPSSPGQLRVAATNIRGRNVLRHLGRGERAAWLISLRRLWLLRRLWFRRGAKARPALVYLSVNQE